MGNVYAVKNRGRCPRGLLTKFGATNKSAEDVSTIGYYGSGAKYAGIAAIRLGIVLRYASSDEVGKYFFGFLAGKEQVLGGAKMTPVLIKFEGEPAIETQMTTQAGRNWTQPIGDDGNASFKVLREVVTNARDPDPQFDRSGIVEVDAFHHAPDGHTVVYISKTPEIEHMLAHADRYFKYLSDAMPLLTVKDFARIYPKSEAGATRMFLQGTLAMCSKDELSSTFFDYSFENKLLVSEERTFENMEAVYRHLGVLMRYLSPEIALQLLEAIVDDKANLEDHALAFVDHDAQIPAAEAWRVAWRRKYGLEAVISTSHYADQVAIYSHKRKPIKVISLNLQRFLALCGIPQSSDFVKAGEKDGYRLVVPSGREKDAYDLALRILHEQYPDTVGVPVHVFEALEEPYLSRNGFCLPVSPPYTETYINRDRLVSVWQTYRTMYHEAHRHVFTQETDGTRKFDHQADLDNMQLVMEKFEIPDDRPPPLPPPKDAIDAFLESIIIEDDS